MYRGRVVLSLLRSVSGDSRGFAASTKKPVIKELVVPKTRRISGYMLFLKDTSSKLRNTGLPVSEISKQVAKQWAETTPAQRQKYIDEATRLNEQKKEAPVKKTEKEPKKEKIKRPPNVYAAFMKSVFPTVQLQYPEKTFAEKSKIVSDMWRNLTDEEKARRKEALLQSTKM